MASENDTPTEQTTDGQTTADKRLEAAAERPTKAPSARAPRKRASRTVDTVGAALPSETADAVLPVKKAAKKAAPRVSRKKAAPAQAAESSGTSETGDASETGAPAASAEVETSAAQADAEAPEPGVAAAPAKKAARKRVSRKAISPVAPPEAESPAVPELPEAAPAATDQDVADDDTEQELPAAATFGVLFQAPTAPPARRSRRASSPAKAAPPAPAAGEDQDPTAPGADLRPAERGLTDGATDPQQTTEVAPHDFGGSDGPTRSTRSRRSSRSSGAGTSVEPSQSDDSAATGAQADLGSGDASHVAEPAELVERSEQAEPADADRSQEPDDSSDGDDGPRRRRRRGGKGRRGRGSDGSTDKDDDGPDVTDSTDSGRTTENADTDSTDSTDGTGQDDTRGSGGRRRGRSGASSTRGSGGPDRVGGRRSADSDSDSTDVDDRSDGAESADGADTADNDSGDSGGSRRRTRRRRRSGSGGDGDEAPNVTTRVRESREPRRASDEVTSVKGSTRLEAKKQRRREGREAGRRRTIITESEFLARRESVERVMVVRHKEDRTQIGVLEDGVLVEHYISRETNVSMAGNIYLGRVQNVLPSMEAAFVDIGKGRNAVLYAGEVNWDAAGLDSGSSRRIEHALGSGQNVLVQVTKDPIGHKGARLTSQVSLPGRYLVYVPESSMTGISRKLPDTERARLKKILKEIVPESAGVIVRTAAEGASEEELRADVERLTTTWEAIRSQVEAGGGRTKAKGKATGSAPTLLHGEPDLTVRVIRDVFNEDFTSLVVAGQQAWDEVSGYVGSVAPDLAERITRWTSEEDLFTHYRIDEQISKAMDRKVWLPSGGSLVIDRTEAMTVIDVNTGKFVGSGGNLEETVTKNNIEAAEEIVRQLRLRDIGGIIVVDFIDMVLEANRDLVVRRLLECLGRDRTKHQVAEVTSLGLVQMTRKRVGSGLIEVFSETCEHCAGRGVIVHADPVDRSNSSPHADTHAAAPTQPAPAARGGRRRGKAVESAPAVAAIVAPTPQRSGGPTPAQIAAAAHAAALKVTAGVAEDIDLPSRIGELSDLGDPVPVPDLELAAVTEVGTEAGAEAASDVVVEAFAAEEVVLGIFVPETLVPDTLVPETLVPETLVPEAEPEVDPFAAPTARPRRRRGRVMSPAGPPRGAEEDAAHPAVDDFAPHEDRVG